MKMLFVMVCGDKFLFLVDLEKAEAYVSVGLLADPWDSVVAQQFNPLPVEVVLHMGASSYPICSTSKPTLCLCTGTAAGDG